MGIISTILTWGFGIFFILLSVAAVFDENISITTSLFLFLAGLILLPPIRKITKLSKHTGKVIAASTVLCLLGIGKLGHEVQLAEARKHGFTSIAEFEKSKKVDVNRPKDAPLSIKNNEQDTKVQKETEEKTASLPKQEEDEQKETTPKKVEGDKRPALSRREDEVWDAALPKKTKKQRTIATNGYIIAFAISSNLSTRCSGIETTKKYKIESTKVFKENKENQQKLADRIVEFSLVWNKLDDLSRMRLCVEGLRRFGPKGSEVSGLLRPNREFDRLLKSMSKEVRAVLGL